MGSSRAYAPRRAVMVQGVLAAARTPGRTPARRWGDRLAHWHRVAGHLHDPEHPARPARLPVLDFHLAALAPHGGLGAARGVGVVRTGGDAPSPAAQGAPPSPIGLTRDRSSPHPCSTYGATRPGKMLDSTALSRPSLIRMRSQVQLRDEVWRVDLSAGWSHRSDQPVGLASLICVQVAWSSSV